MPKKDLVITAMSGYQWEQIRPFVLSLDRSGFEGDKIILDAGLSSFTRDCLVNRGYQVIPTGPLPGPPLFVIYYRYLPLLNFLKEHGSEYRYVIWADAGDQIFQANPTPWLTEYATPHTFIAAREGWLIKDEIIWNDQWIKESLPEDYDWLREHEVICAGTMAGDAATVHNVVKQICDTVWEQKTTGKSVWGADQAILNYLIRKPFPIASNIPALNDGWCATLSSVITENFHSGCGFSKERIAIAPPVFDVENGVVLTPDGKKPFVLVHQYNRDGRWTQIMHTKYREW